MNPTSSRDGALRATPRLVRLGLRRDRIVLPVWTLITGGLMGAIAVSLVGLYTTEQERIAAATFSAANPVVRAFDGPAAGADIGSLILMEGYWLVAVLIGLAASQTVVRHTRADEEVGRAELIGAAVVGRHARLAAALVVALIGVVATATAVMGVLVAVGLDGAGTVLTGATLIGCGAVFAAVAALVAQVVTRSRTANALAAGAIGVAFALRAVGDAAGRPGADGVRVISAWPSWLSPIGWGQQPDRSATGGGGCWPCSSARSPSCSSWPRRPVPAGISGARCSRHGRARPAPDAGCRVRSASHGGCSARSCWAGWRPCWCSGPPSGPWETARTICSH